MPDMTSEGEHDREESSSPLEREIVQELGANVSPPTLDSDNPELGTEALTRVVREVLEKAFKAGLEQNKELVQGGCEDCEKKKDRNSSMLEPYSVKCDRTHSRLGTVLVAKMADLGLF
ncbi:hypothetical protein PVK06_020093 [Gossypium arboreum]|uniref:Uncharacterized protein n=1 Tax=Gossypium arboreum TaxID=29729 RepID=A0ABR0PM05_GOSAR|nr:hypothetical protein PVK06_020093 [Gossypium arboreum]